MIKKIWLLSGILAITLVFAICTNIDDSEATDSETTGPTSGSCGEKASFTFDEATGTLTISGKGAMDNYNESDGGRPPWHPYKDKIKTVIIEDGIAKIGTYTFVNCTSMVSVSLGDSVTRLSAFAFYHCDSLITLDLNKVVTLDIQSIYMCESLANVKCDQVGGMGAQVFLGCKKLESINLPKIQTIRSNCLEDTPLKRISIGSGLNSADFSEKYSSFGRMLYNADGTPITNVNDVKSSVFLLNEEGKMIKQETYSINFYVKDTNYTTLYYAVGEKIIKPADPELSGYIFKGWDREIPETMPAENLGFYSKWVPSSCTVTIEGEGITVKNEEAVIASGTAVDYDTVLTVIIADRIGYTGTVKVGDEIVNGTWTVKGDATFTGTYSINSYKIAFDTDGGSGIPEMTVEFGGTVTAPDNPMKEGYTFAGWDKEIPTTMPAENLTIKAKWTPIKYTVSYEDSSIIIKNRETTIVSGTEIDYDTILTVTAAYVEGKTGIIKVGEETVNGTWTVKGNVTFTITYVTSVYDVVFNPDNGKESDNCSVEHGKTVAKPETPVKKGFTFLGWFLNDTEYDFEKPVTENMTIVAKWGALPFIITFNADDVTVKNGAQIVNNGETIDSGTVLTVTAIDHAGYTVVRIKAGEIMLTSETFIVEGDVEFSVEYSINEYTISFDTDGGSEIPEMTVEFGGTVATPENPTKEGYTFAGWDKEIPATMPAENLTIKATWIINQYVVTIKGEGVTVKNGEDIVASGTSVDYNTVLTVIIAEKEGHTGTVKVEDTVVNGTWTVKGDTTFTGTYSINQYIVTIEGEGVTVKNGETAISSGDKVDHGTELTITIAEKDGYTGTVKAGDNTVDGTWTVTDNVTFEGIYDEKPSSNEDKSMTTIIVAAVVIIGIVAVGGYFFVNRP